FARWLPDRSHGRESASPQTARALRRTPGQTEANHGCIPARNGRSRKLFDWRSALVVVKPDTFLKWHRTGFRAFWRWKSRKRGRPALPENLRELIRQIAAKVPVR